MGNLLFRRKKCESVSFSLTIDPNLSVENLTVRSDMPVDPLAPVDPIAPINPIVPVDPNLTVQDRVNPENEYEIKERHRLLPKRRCRI